MKPKQLLANGTGLIITCALFGAFRVSGQNTMSLNIDQATYTINKELYGALMEDWGRGIYTGVYVGKSSSIPNTNGIRKDVIEGFKEAGLTCLDWPGGCYAEHYLWTDGIGNNRVGGDMKNGLGTAEYFQLCQLLGTVPYITANVTNQPPTVMAAWLNHIDSLYPGKLKYWKMGNEIWNGCGVVSGKSVTEYLNDYDRYKIAIPSKFSGKLFRIADGGTGNRSFPTWLDSVMLREKGSIEGVAYHYYSGLNNSGPSFNFTEEEYYSRLALGWAIESKMTYCETIMNKHDPDYTVGLMVDEWGAWYTGIDGMGNAYQQNTCRDAIIASMHLNVFNNHCRRVKMAMVAQPVNVIHSLFLTKSPPTNDLIKTPTFYVFKMYKVHQNAKMVPITLSTAINKNVPLINASASVDSTGKLHISMCNTHISAPQTVTITLNSGPAYASCTGTIITGPTYKSYNDYGGVEPVSLQSFASTNFSLSDTTLVATIPAHSVVTFELIKKSMTALHDGLSQRRHDGWLITPMSGGAIRISNLSASQTSMRLELFSIDGRTLVMSRSYNSNTEKNSIVWQPGTLIAGSGAYMVRIVTDGTVLSQRVLLLR